MENKRLVPSCGKSILHTEEKNPFCDKCFFFDYCLEKYDEEQKNQPIKKE